MSAALAVNTILAILGAIAAICAIDRMGQSTPRSMVIAVATVAVGLAGYALGVFFPERWQLGCDTLLLGGVVAYLIGGRRRPLFTSDEMMSTLSLAVSAATWSSFFLTIT